MTVFQFTKKYLYLLKYPFLLSLLFLIIAETLGRIGTFYGSRLIGLISTDTADRQSALGAACLYILLYGGFTALRGIIAVAPIYFDAKYLPFIQSQATQKLFNHIHHQSSSFFEQEMSGNIASKINNIGDQISELYYAFIWSIFQPLVVTFVILISVSLVNVSLGLGLTLIMAVYFCLMYQNSKKIMPFSRETTRLSSLSNAEMVDSITNAETVKSFGRSIFEKIHYFKDLKKVCRAERREIKTKSLMGLIQGTFRAVIQVLFCLVPALYWYFNLLSLQDFVFIQSLIMTLNSTIGSTTDDFIKFLSRYTIAQEALDLLFQPVTVTDAPNATSLVLTKGHIHIKNITYKYQKLKPIFNDFSLDIKPCQKIGLMGYSGCGKTTLIKLINRYYDVEKGAILIDGRDIKTVTQKSLHAVISFVPQEPSLLNRTVMENIRYGNPSATDKEVYAAAKRAYAHDFIKHLPNGYNSTVGERGVMLSGGERQRLAIARAILKNAPILILDEATSALDSDSEKYIQKSLQNLMAGKTVIAIAHRLSTLQEMDNIIVLDKGQIIERGTHAKLLRQKGTYYQFYQMQSQAFLKE